VGPIGIWRAPMVAKTRRNGRALATVADARNVSVTVCSTVGDTTSIWIVESATPLTATGTVPWIPSITALTMTVPASTARTRPALVTVAIAGFDELQATARPGCGAPAALNNVAENCTDSPTNISELVGLTTTEAAGTAGGMTVTGNEPETAPDAAPIIAMPGASAVTTPEFETLATPGAELVQVVELSENGRSD
jgi:hypothetical protein